MAKWYGKVGYATKAETSPGIWEEIITEKSYYGDVTSNRYKHQNSGIVNTDLNLTIYISILADPFAYNNCSDIAYVEYNNCKWKVSDIDPSQRPRIILTIGGKYNA